MKISRIINRGENGAEIGALKAAKRNDIKTAGWTTKGAETQNFGLSEANSIKEEQSIMWNVRDAHAVLIIKPIADYLTSNLSLEIAETYQRPVLVSDDSAEIIDWLNKLGEELILYITGPKEADIDGAEKETTKIINKVLKHFTAL